MISLRNVVVFTALILIMNFSQPAFAGSGAFRNETVDAATIAMGNAFVGQANSPAAVYYNPAGLNQIDTISFTSNDAVIAPRASFKDFSGDKIQMRNNEFNIPAFYAVVPVIKNKFTIGAGVGSYWGLGSDWPPNSPLKTAATKSNMTNTDSMITAAYQVTNQWSVAVSADNDYSRADENKKFSNLDGTYGNFELKGDDDAWGYRLATLFKINEQNQVGLMYRSPISHKYHGNAYLDDIGPAYSGYFGAGVTSYETKVTEKLVLPQSVVIGYSLKPTTKWTINMDIEWMDWASIKRETLDFPDAGPGPLGFLTYGNSNVITHDWTSAWSEAIGTEYKLTQRFRLRAGFYHHGTVGGQDYFNPAIADLQTFGITGGFGYDLTKNLTIDVGYSGQFSRPRKIKDNLLGQVNGKYYEFVNDGAVSLTYKF